MYDLDKPGDVEKLARLAKHEDSGQMFRVYREGAIEGGKRVVKVEITTIDYFPSESQIIDLVFEEHGGGNYVIASQWGHQVFKTYRIPGPGKYSPRGVADDFGAMSYISNDLAQSDPELAKAIRLELALKSLGIKKPSLSRPTDPNQGVDEEVEEYLDQHPELKEARIKAKLRKQGVKLPEEGSGSDLDEFIRTAEQVDRVRGKLTGRDRSGGGSGAMEIIRDVADGFKELVKENPDIIKPGFPISTGPG